MPHLIVTVDPGFPALLRRLRRARGTSLRRLGRLVNYSHTYLWEIETGRKQPTVPIAAVLDTALGAQGALTGLVAERAAPRPARAARRTGPAVRGAAEALEAVVDSRRELEGAVSLAWSAAADGQHSRAATRASVVEPPGTGATVDPAARWAQAASWLYDMFVRSRPRLRRHPPTSPRGCGSMLVAR
jgi:transcriptional regulator with XRE-family HTH domain